MPPLIHPPDLQPVVVDYGLGNLHSVVHKLRALGCDPRVSRLPDDIVGASHLVLPGVGNFGVGAANLRRMDLVGPLEEAVLARGTPILGICLGMQLFLEHSDESDVAGLGWIKGEVRRFDWSAERPRWKVPHMGWNNVRSPERPWWCDGISDDVGYYFLHSYYATGVPPDAVRGMTSYDIDFVSVIEQDNILGVQFHPEKSRGQGLRLIKNFLEAQVCSGPG